MEEQEQRYQLFFVVNSLGSHLISHKQLWKTNNILPELHFQQEQNCMDFCPNDEGRSGPAYF